LVNAVMLGLVAYATYDLTNQATLKTWSTTITLDMAWGVLVTDSRAHPPATKTVLRLTN
jgi:uncharacterized membrane protein